MRIENRDENENEKMTKIETYMKITKTTMKTKK